MTSLQIVYFLKTAEYMSFSRAAQALYVTQPSVSRQIKLLEAELGQPGNYVLMKSASRMAEVKELLRRSGRAVSMVENCCMEGEKRYLSVDEIPDDAGYFSLIIAKERKAP